VNIFKVTTFLMDLASGYLLMEFITGYCIGTFVYAKMKARLDMRKIKLLPQKNNLDAGR
jgi:hypothetical protein